MSLPGQRLSIAFVFPIALLAPASAQNSSVQHDAIELSERADAFCTPLVTSGIVPGLVVGMIDGDVEFVRAYGTLAFGGQAAPDRATLYEIGSISKVFTGLLLADAVKRGLVALEDPVQKHLPEGVTLRPRRGRDILLWHLATHTSGLPRMPRVKAPDARDPFAHYDTAGMHAVIDDARARQEPGRRYEYSNLGAGILSYVLMRVNGCESFDEMLKQRITEPMAMASTVAELSDELPERLAPPYDANGEPALAWRFGHMAGAGGIRSTVPDMLRFARQQLDPGDSPLAEAILLQQKKHHDGKNGLALGLGWHIAQEGASLVHSGQTGGFHAYLAVVPATQRVVCLLANCAVGQVDAVGERLLQAMHGHAVAPLEFERPVAVAVEALERLVGSYRWLGGAELAVTRRGAALFAQIQGQPAWRIYPRSGNEFFYRIVGATITCAAEGTVDELTLHQGGKDLRYERVRANKAGNEQRDK